jgi:hypothetical protein
VADNQQDNMFQAVALAQLRCVEVSTAARPGTVSQMLLAQTYRAEWMVLKEGGSGCTFHELVRIKPWLLWVVDGCVAVVLSRVGMLQL